MNIPSFGGGLLANTFVNINLYTGPRLANNMLRTETLSSPLVPFGALVSANPLASLLVPAARPLARLFPGLFPLGNWASPAVFLAHLFPMASLQWLRISVAMMRYVVDILARVPSGVRGGLLRAPPGTSQMCGCRSSCHFFCRRLLWAHCRPGLSSLAACVGHP